MRQLQVRFPHCVHLEWTGRPRRPTGAATRSGCAAAATSRSPVSSCACARRSGHAGERELLGRALGRCRDARRAPVRLHRAARSPPSARSPSTVEVDLDEVGRDGLFLLWGPTGAGKTTLLDAVVFALYGTVPGARGEEKRLRSDHAADDARTEVELRGDPGGRAAAGHPPPRAAAPEEARRGLDHRAGQADRAALTDGGLGAGEHPHRRGLRAPAHPAGAVRRAVLPGRAAAAGRLRRASSGPSPRTGPAAAHPLRRRPLRPGRGLAGRRAPVARSAARRGPASRRSTLLAGSPRSPTSRSPEELAPALVGWRARRPALGAPGRRAAQPLIEAGRRPAAAAAAAGQPGRAWPPRGPRRSGTPAATARAGAARRAARRGRELAAAARRPRRRPARRRRCATCWRRRARRARRRAAAAAPRPRRRPGAAVAGADGDRHAAPASLRDEAAGAAPAARGRPREPRGRSGADRPSTAHPGLAGAGDGGEAAGRGPAGSPAQERRVDRRARPPPGCPGTAAAEAAAALTEAAPAADRLEATLAAPQAASAVAREAWPTPASTGRPAQPAARRHGCRARRRPDRRAPTARSAAPSSTPGRPSTTARSSRRPTSARPRRGRRGRGSAATLAAEAVEHGRSRSWPRCERRPAPAAAEQASGRSPSCRPPAQQTARPPGSEQAEARLAALLAEREPAAQRLAADREELQAPRRRARRARRRRSPRSTAAGRGPGRVTPTSPPGSAGSPARPAVRGPSRRPRPTSSAPALPRTAPASPPSSAPPRPGSPTLLAAAAALLDRRPPAPRSTAARRARPAGRRAARAAGRSRARRPRAPPRPRRTRGAVRRRHRQPGGGRRRARPRPRPVRRGARRAGRRRHRGGDRARPSCAAAPTEVAGLADLVDRPRRQHAADAAAVLRPRRPAGAGRRGGQPAAAGHVRRPLHLRCTATPRAGTAPAAAWASTSSTSTPARAGHQDPLRRRELHGLTGAGPRPGRRRHRRERAACRSTRSSSTRASAPSTPRRWTR